MRALPRPVRRGVGCAVLVALVALASGCVGFRSAGAAQPTQIGDVRVSVVVCAAQTTGCNGRGNSDTAPGEGATGQLLLAYRIPAGSAAPATLTSARVSFAASDGYAAELQRLAPAPTGTRWVGYLSDPFTHTAATSAAGLAVSADFGLPTTPGAAFAGPFAYRPVVGARSVTAATPASRPVACGDALTAQQSDGADGVVVCADAPVRGQIGTDLTVATQDLVVVAGATGIPAPAGSVVAVPFTLRHGGRGPALAVTLSATTSLPGASAAPSPGTIVPVAGSDHQALVVVGIPPGARPAVHGVTLRATVPGGTTREMTTRIVVRRPAGAAPAGSAAARAVRFGWRPDRRARFYNLQVFSRAKKVASLFPDRPGRQVRLRPGRYRVVVWTGLDRASRGRYASRPWVNRTITLRPASTAAARKRPLVVRLR